MRYLDTGNRSVGESLYGWLESVLPDAIYFGAQTGYFSFDGIFPLQKEFDDLLQRGGALHLVIGANEAGVRRVDLEDVLDLFDTAPPHASASLTLVGADDVLMHPKAYYVETADGTTHALVGSANLTNAGLSRNIEAALVIDSRSDPGAPFTEIRLGIDRWRLGNHPNAYPVDRQSLAKLVGEGLFDVRRVSPPITPKGRRERSRTFPGLGAFIRLPQRRRMVAPESLTARPTGPSQVPLDTLETLPKGAVGIIKSLSKLDVKGFHGGTGTSYIALPVDLVPFLPLTPFGKHQEPRVDVSVEARLEGAASEIVRSGISPANITHVGQGKTRVSHGDLRFNYLTTIRKGIEGVAASNHLQLPKVGHLAAIEILDGVRVRVTFITDATSIANMSPLLDHSDGAWGWLPPSVIGSWDPEADA